MTDDLSFRPAVAEDVARLQPFVHAAYRGDSARRGWTHEADLLDGQRIDAEALHALIADPVEVIIIAEDGPVIVGCVRVTDAGGELGSLGLLAVDPVRQAEGLGRRLIARRSRGAQPIFRRSHGDDRHRPANRTDRLVRAAGICADRRNAAVPGDRSSFRPTEARGSGLSCAREGSRMTRIVTERLLLRTAEPGDLEALHAVLSDPRATRWWSTPPHETLEETSAWLDDMIARGPDHPDFVVALEGRVIGKVGFYQMPVLGYILHPDVWGRGLASEAVGTAIDHVFRMPGVGKVTADVDPENMASIRLLERLGFVCTGFGECTWNVGGLWKDSLFYALSRADRAARLVTQARA